MHDLETFQLKLADWASRALPARANHLLKLQEELDELKDAPSDPGEIGDVLLALSIHASSQKVSLFTQERLQYLNANLWSWAAKTFFPVQDTLSKVQSALDGLMTTPSDSAMMEALMLALAKHSASQDISMFIAAQNKFEIVQHRTYGPPDATGISRHIAEKSA